jgi:hypothetical protein
MHILEPPPTSRDHTYHNGMAVRDWLRKERPDATAIDLFTASIHARKSRLMYAKVLGPCVQVGIIPASPPVFPHRYWWLSPTGIYLVLRNTAGYLYAVFSSPPAE